MNRGITIARKGETFEFLVGPEVSFNEQRRNFRKLRAGLTGYDEVELWSSGQGRVKRYRFKAKVQHVVPPAASEKGTTDAESSQTPVSSSEPDAKALAAPAESAPSSSANKPAKVGKGAGKKTSKKK